MSVLIDYRVCDANPACGAARFCAPMGGALYYDNAEGKPIVDNSKCTDCFVCIKGCPSGAIKTASNEAELKSIEEEIEKSSLSKDDLLEQKYGVRPSDPSEIGENMFEATTNNWDEKVINSELPVIVDFWASWCAPCRIIAPVFKDLAKEYRGKIVFAKLDTEAHIPISQMYRIMNIPSLVILHKGKPVDVVVGAVPREELKRRIDAAIAAIY